MAASAYHGAFYDVVHGRRCHDVAWYLALAEKVSGPILEIGAGTGRIAIPLAEQGNTVHAVEPDAGMRERLIEKLRSLDPAVRERIEVSSGSMVEPAPAQDCSLVILGFRTFQHALTSDAQRRCLSACFDALEIGGILALDVFMPSLEMMAEASGPMENVWRLDSRWEGEDGSELQLSESRRYRQGPHYAVAASYRYDEIGADGRLLSSFFQTIELALRFPAELTSQIAEAGFADIRLGAEFTDRAIDDETSEIAVTALKPPPKE